MTTRHGDATDDEIVLRAERIAPDPEIREGGVKIDDAGLEAGNVVAASGIGRMVDPVRCEQVVEPVEIDGHECIEKALTMRLLSSLLDTAFISLVTRPARRPTSPRATP